MIARYVGDNLVDRLSWDNIYIQLRTIAQEDQSNSVLTNI